MSYQMRLGAITGIAENGAIGKDGRVPWDIPEDKQFYRSTAAGHPLIIGRKTFSGPSIDGCDYIVMSRSEQSYESDRVHAAQSGREAVDIAERLVEQEYDTNTVYNLGGAEIYELFLPYTEELIISYIEGEYDGDTFFPEWNPEDWTVKDREQRDQFEIVRYRQTPKPLSSLDE